MKYLIFAFFMTAIVPAMTGLAVFSRRGRAILLGLLVLSPALGSAFKINFWSMELYRGPDRGFEVTLTDLIAVSLAAAVVLRPRGRVSWVPQNSVLLAGYFGCSVLSLAWSPDALISTFTLFKLLRYFLVYWVLVNTIRSRQDVRAVLTGWMIAGAIIAMHAIVQKYGLGVWRVHGPFDHSNTIPMFLNPVLGAVLIWALVDPDLSPVARAAALASVLGMMFTILATFSRAGIALCAGAFLASLAVTALRAPSRRTYCVGFIAMLLALAGAIKAAPRVMDRFENAPAASKEARDEFNAAAVAMIMDNPQGVGINTFSLVMAEPRYLAHTRVLANETPPGVLHNIYFLTLVELGAIGFAVFLAMMARFLWIAFKAALRRPSLESLVAASLVIGMTTVHAAGFLEWALRITPVGYQFASVAALAVALARGLSPEPGPGRTAR